MPRECWQIRKIHVKLLQFLLKLDDSIKKNSNKTVKYMSNQQLNFLKKHLKNKIRGQFSNVFKRFYKMQKTTGITLKHAVSRTKCI